MAVVDFGAPKVGTTRTSTHVRPKYELVPSILRPITVVQGAAASVTRYFKRGFRTATGQFEYWSTTIRDAGPPSGNILIDITVIGEVRD